MCLGCQRHAKQWYAILILRARSGGFPCHTQMWKSAFWPVELHKVSPGWAWGPRLTVGVVNRGCSSAWWREARGWRAWDISTDFLLVWDPASQQDNRVAVWSWNVHIKRELFTFNSGPPLCPQEGNLCLLSILNLVPANAQDSFSPQHNAGRQPLMNILSSTDDRSDFYTQTHTHAHTHTYTHFESCVIWLLVCMLNVNKISLLLLSAQ